MKKMKISLLPIITLAAVALAFVSCSQNEQVQTSTHYNLPEDAVSTVRSANEVIQDFVSVSGREIPNNVLENAAGIAIVPELTKAAFIAGGRHGTGLFLSHGQDKWSLPVFASITGASVGAQIGISTTDIVLVFRNQDAVDALKKGGKFTLGADLAVAAGPVGGSANLSALNADVLAYSRTEGAFAGVALTGGTMSMDRDQTTNYYASMKPEAARGYYGEGGMLESLLNPDKAADLANVPPGAAELKQRLDRITGM